MKLKDCFWIWGHHAGCHHTGEAKAYNIPGTNKMGPWEGAEYLGIPNCCRVVYGGIPKPPFDGESDKLKPFKKVIWSVLGDASSKRNDEDGDDLEEVLRQAEKYPNIVGGILDDLFRVTTKDARLSPEDLHRIAERMHNAHPRRLDLWLVYYAALFEVDYTPWLEAVDGITFWSWNSEQLAQAEENLNRIISMTPGKEHYAGCYLYNYGDFRPITLDEMKFQMDLYYKFLREGRIKGVIVCSNTIADTGLEAPEYFRQWMLEHGDKEIS